MSIRPKSVEPVVGGWNTATVRAAHMAIPNGRLLTLDVPDWTGSLPGQHLDLRLTAEDGYQAVRSYSMASYGPTTVVELAVDRLPDGEVSPYLVDDLQPGDQFEVKGPLGGYFVWRDIQPEPVQLVAGGSGVVPLMAMARAHRDSGSAAPFRMLYSVRTAGHAYYADELATLVDERFTLDWVYTGRVPDGWGRPAGRIDRDILEALTIDASEQPTVYICGATGFVETAASLMVKLGHHPTRIKTERYGGA
jgi:ferredoxin-NADP reductase